MADYFNMYNTVSESNADEDLGSGGAMVVPAFKDSSGLLHHWSWAPERTRTSIWRIASNMGKFNPNNNSQLYQEVTGRDSGAGVFGAGVCQQENLLRGVDDTIKAFSFNASGLLDSTPASETTTQLQLPGSHAQHFWKFGEQFDFVGDGEYLAGGAACLQCDKS